MEEKEFVERIGRLSLTYLDINISVEIPVYYTLDDKGNVMVDFESMRKEFNEKLDEISKLE